MRSAFAKFRFDAIFAIAMATLFVVSGVLAGVSHARHVPSHVTSATDVASQSGYGAAGLDCHSLVQKVLGDKSDHGSANGPAPIAPSADCDCGCHLVGNVLPLPGMTPAAPASSRIADSPQVSPPLVALGLDDPPIIPAFV